MNAARNATLFSITYTTNSQEEEEEARSATTKAPATTAATDAAAGTTTTPYANDTANDDETLVGQTDTCTSTSMTASTATQGGIASMAGDADRDVSNCSSTLLVH
jgi:hypothetical protein